MLKENYFYSLCQKQQIIMRFCSSRNQNKVETRPITRNWTFVDRICHEDYFLLYSISIIKKKKKKKKKKYAADFKLTFYPASILYKSIAGCYRPVRVADGPITARYRLIKNAGWL